MSNTDFYRDTNFEIAVELTMRMVRDSKKHTPAHKLMDLMVVKAFYESPLRQNENFDDEHIYFQLIDFYYKKVLQRCCLELCAHRK